MNPGASESEILELENGLGVKLPEDFRESLRIHNGQAGDFLRVVNSSSKHSKIETIEQAVAHLVCQSLPDPQHFRDESKAYGY